MLPTLLLERVEREADDGFLFGSEGRRREREQGAKGKREREETRGAVLHREKRGRKADASRGGRF
jgi:hypothetical protein